MHVLAVWCLVEPQIVELHCSMVIISTHICQTLHSLRCSNRASGHITLPQQIQVGGHPIVPHDVKEIITLLQKRQT